MNPYLVSSEALSTTQPTLQLFDCTVRFRFCGALAYYTLIQNSRSAPFFIEHGAQPSSHVIVLGAGNVDRVHGASILAYISRTL